MTSAIRTGLKQFIKFTLVYRRILLLRIVIFGSNSSDSLHEDSVELFIDFRRSVTHSGFNLI